MKLASISARTGFETALSSRFLSTIRMPPGGLPVAAGASSTSVVGKAKLASTATSAAAKVPSRYRISTGRMWVGWPVLVVGDRRRHQHEDQDRRDGLQRGDEEVAEQGDRLGRARRDQRQGDAEDQTDGDLGDEAHAQQALQGRGGCGSH